MEDYQWIKQLGQRFVVEQVETRPSTDPSYVLCVVHLVLESGDRQVHLECQARTSPDQTVNIPNVQDVVVVKGSNATAVVVERERDGARCLLVVPRNAFDI